MVLVILMVFTVSTASADYNVFHLEPVDSSCDNSGDATTVWVKVNTSYSDVTSFQASIIFDPDVVNVTDVETSPISWTIWGWSIYDYGDKKCVKISATEYVDSYGPGELLLGKMTLYCEAPGVSSLHFANTLEVGGDRTEIASDSAGLMHDDAITTQDGTFTCGSVQTFTKSLPEGWNLISLPLAPTDNSVGTALSGVTQNAVKLYNATSKEFEDATTMDPGIGYFVHVTESGGSTWSYLGTPVSSTNPGLKSGLNMIGVPNCTKSVSAAMGSADYRYVARWNAAAQEYEVYNPVAPSAFHGFTEMAAGEGYFVSAKSDYALNINCPG